MRGAEMVRQYQVVAVYPSGNEYPVRKPHATLAGAMWHLEDCERGHDEAAEGFSYWVRVMGAGGE